MIITDRGKPAHVLLHIGDYRRLTGKPGNLIAALAMPGLAAIDFDPPRLEIQGRFADLA